MAKFDLNKLPKSARIKLIGEFYDAISCLKNREEVKAFFRDLLTPDEIAMLARRIQVAFLIEAGFGYREIRELLGVGKAKILNVKRSLERHGEGYRIVLTRLRKIIRKKEKEARKKNKPAYFPSLEYLKRKYPTHFLLFNLMDELENWLNDDGKIDLERQAGEVKKRIQKGKRYKDL